MVFIFAADVDSAVADSECAALAELARDRVVLELGSFLGRSTIAMAANAKRVHAVDWHRGDAHAGARNTWRGFIKNIEKYGVREKVVAHVGRFEDVLPVFAQGTFDVAFIDGFHERAAVERDISLALPAMKLDGVMAFHDYGLPAFGVTAAVDAFAASRGAKVDLVRTLAIVRFPKSST